MRGRGSHPERLLGVRRHWRGRLGQVRDVWDETNYPENVDAVEEYLESRVAVVSKRRKHGNVAEEVLAVADEIGVDSIVMGERKWNSTVKVWFGSTTQSVILSTNYPMTITLID